VFNYQKRRYYIYKRVQSVSLLKQFMLKYVFDVDACLLVLIEKAGDEVLGSIRDTEPARLIEVDALLDNVPRSLLPIQGNERHAVC
jgi:hypothetical protein